jgi:hypothetical protein
VRNLLLSLLVYLLSRHCLAMVCERLILLSVVTRRQMTMPLLQSPGNRKLSLTDAARTRHWTWMVKFYVVLVLRISDDAASGLGIFVGLTRVNWLR